MGMSIALHEFDPFDFIFCDGKEKDLPENAA